MMAPSQDSRRIEAAIGVVVRDGLILIAQRKADDVLGGYWEFPGGKCEDGETLEQCVIRELREELDIDAMPVAKLTPIEHVYAHARLRLHPFVCRHVGGEIRLIECQDARWIKPESLPTYRFPPANERLIEEVIAMMQSRRALHP